MTEKENNSQPSIEKHDANSSSEATADEIQSLVEQKIEDEFINTEAKRKLKSLVWAHFEKKKN